MTDGAALDGLDLALAHALQAGAWSPALAQAGDRLLERIDFHGVGPLLQASLEQAPEVPSAVQDALRERARRAAAVELARRAELVRVLDRLHEVGLEPVLLKGAALAHEVYPQPHLRPAVDVDLMVAPAQRHAVADVLRREGYATTAFQGGALVNAQASHWRELPHGVALTLDVHWRIATSPLFAHVLSYDWLRSRARPLRALGAHGRGPAPVDALLHGCVHRAGVEGRNPGADRLIWLHDLHLLAARLDRGGWEEFVALARRHRVLRLCRRALDATEAAFDTAIPADIRAQLGAARPEPADALVGGSRLRLKGAELAALPSWRERALYVRETAFPAPAYVLERYGERRRWLLPWLYARRAFGWLARP